jgi:hypothetical protein
MNTNDKEREDFETLLPWHAAGTLNRRDAERVEKALAGDRELLGRFNLAREELNETIHLNETLSAPSARAMEKLFAAIDAEPVRQPKVSLDPAGRLASFVASFSPRTLAMAGAVGALAIVLQAGVITTGLIKHEIGTEVASRHGPGLGTELAAADVSQDTVAAIRFAPRADVSQVRAFLLANKASIIDGPTQGGGIHSICLPETGKANEDHIRHKGQSTNVDRSEAVASTPHDPFGVRCIQSRRDF